jgi:hypothetical protein
MKNQSNNGLHLADSYIYTPATTDVTIRWRKVYGWIPPTEDPIFRKNGHHSVT